MDDTERSDLLAVLAKQRDLFLMTTHGLEDSPARTRHSVSELTLGGLVKHVTATVRQWLDFVRNGPPQGPDVDWDNVDWSDPPAEVLAVVEGHTMREDQTLESLVEDFRRAAAETDELVRTVDLDESHELPRAPWFESGERWTNRRVFVHLVAEMSQHAGHADIVRESFDGQKTMG